MKEFSLARHRCYLELMGGIGYSLEKCKNLSENIAKLLPMVEEAKKLVHTIEKKSSPKAANGPELLRLQEKIDKIFEQIEEAIKNCRQIE